jgi:hypothetical protein
MNVAGWLAGYLAIVLTVAAGTDVSGVVRDGNGRPLRDARVSLMRVDDAPPELPGGKPRKTLVELDTMRTSAAGVFRFAGVSNGRYQLLIARDRNWLIAEGLVLNGAPVGPFALVLDGKTRLVTLPVKRLPAA